MVIGKSLRVKRMDWVIGGKAASRSSVSAIAVVNAVVFVFVVVPVAAIESLIGAVNRLV